MDAFNYENVLSEANGYFNAAKGGYGKPKKFNGELVFSILTMAIEKYLVSLLLARDIIPEGHTIKGLLEELDKCFLLDEKMKATLSKVDEYMYLCSMDAYKRKTPAQNELQELMNEMENLKELAIGSNKKLTEE